MLRNPGTTDVIVARIWTDTALEQDTAGGNYATTEVAQVRTAGDAATS